MEASSAATWLGSPDISQLKSSRGLLVAHFRQTNNAIIFMIRDNMSLHPSSKPLYT